MLRTIVTFYTGTAGSSKRGDSTPQARCCCLVRRVTVTRCCRTPQFSAKEHARCSQAGAVFAAAIYAVFCCLVLWRCVPRAQLSVIPAYQLIAPPVILSQSQQMDDGGCQQQEQRRDQQTKQHVFVIPESSSSSSSKSNSPVRRAASPALALSASKRGFKVPVADVSPRAACLTRLLRPLPTGGSPAFCCRLRPLFLRMRTTPGRIHPKNDA